MVMILFSMMEEVFKCDTETLIRLSYDLFSVYLHATLVKVLVSFMPGQSQMD